MCPTEQGSWIVAWPLSYGLRRQVEVNAGYSSWLEPKQSFTMSGELKSLESVLDKYIPKEELQEVKRILYGKQLW